MRELTRIFCVSLAIVWLLLSGFFSGPETAFAADQPIKLKILASWAANFLYTDQWLIPLTQKLNQRSGGRLQVTWVGPEAVAPFEQFKTVSAGLFDILFTSPEYHMGEVPVGASMVLLKGTPKARRAAGFVEILDEAYKKANVRLLGFSSCATGYHLILRKELTKADLTGLKIRTTPFYDPMVAALGGATLRTGPGEVYSALEKGVADGAIYPVVPTLDFKLHEVTKFQVRPQVGELIEFLLVNLDSWNKLPKDLQNLITQTVQEMEEEGYKDLTVKGKASEDKLVASGLKLNPLPPAEAEKYEKAFYNPIMEEMIVKRSPEFGLRMKRAADTYRGK